MDFQVEETYVEGCVYADNDQRNVELVGWIPESIMQDSSLVWFDLELVSFVCKKLLYICALYWLCVCVFLLKFLLWFCSCLPVILFVFVF